MARGGGSGGNKSLIDGALLGGGIFLLIKGVEWISNKVGFSIPS